MLAHPRPLCNHLDGPGDHPPGILAMNALAFQVLDGHVFASTGPGRLRWMRKGSGVMGQRVLVRMLAVSPVLVVFGFSVWVIFTH